MKKLCLSFPFPASSSAQPCEIRLMGYMDTNLNNGAPPPHPCGLDSSRSLFQCYVSKEGQVSSRAPRTAAGGVGGGASGGLEAGGGTLLQELSVTAEKEAILLAHFSIPNCVNSDQSSTVEEDDLLLDQTGRDHNDHGDFT